jgi:hypothetical protein
MRKLNMGDCIVLIAFLTAMPLMAQRGDSGPANSGRGYSVDSGSTATATTSGYSDSGRASSGSSASYAGSNYSNGMGNRGYSPMPTVTTPNLHGSSFYSVRMYNYWSDYYSYLYSYYHIYPEYFGRFLRNQEPLMTPALLRLTLRRPLSLSNDILRSVDELEAMLTDARDGKAIDKRVLLDKLQEIREYAKEIRKDRTLATLDMGRDTVLFKEDGIDALAPETIAKLRDMALDLNRQLRNMYTLSSTSTVSVDSYKEPSFESVTKSIEKVCKAIEHSSKQL